MKELRKAVQHGLFRDAMLTEVARERTLVNANGGRHLRIFEVCSIYEVAQITEKDFLCRFQIIRSRPDASIVAFSGKPFGSYSEFRGEKIKLCSRWDLLPFAIFREGNFGNSDLFS